VRKRKTRGAESGFRNQVRRRRGKQKAKGEGREDGCLSTAESGGGRFQQGDIRVRGADDKILGGERSKVWGKHNVLGKGPILR